MPFKQGVRPAFRVAPEDQREFRADLRAQGYKPHRGARVRRDGEIGAWTAPLPDHRQVHVQEVREADGIAVYAHTEPAGAGAKHGLSALTDKASFSAGARVLRADLRERGWDA
jgi:hypothetical protein